jgi:hypothetical protein
MANIYGYSSLDEALSVLEEDYNKSLKGTPIIYSGKEFIKRIKNLSEEDIKNIILNLYK